MIKLMRGKGVNCKTIKSCHRTSGGRKVCKGTIRRRVMVSRKGKWTFLKGKC